MTVDSVKDVIEQNAQNKFPEKLVGFEESAASMAGVFDYQNSAGIESLTRFEDTPTGKKGNKKNKKKKSHHKGVGKSFHKNKRRDHKPAFKKQDKSPTT